MQQPIRSIKKHYSDWMKHHAFLKGIEGDFQPSYYPTETQLLAKRGAQVMFIKNDGKNTPEWQLGNSKTHRRTIRLMVSRIMDETRAIEKTIKVSQIKLGKHQIST